MKTRGAAADLNMDGIASATSDCPVCGGDGFLIADDDAELQCEACDGSGQRQTDNEAA